MTAVRGASLIDGRDEIVTDPPVPIECADDRRRVGGQGRGGGMDPSAALMNPTLDQWLHRRPVSAEAELAVRVVGEAGANPGVHHALAELGEGEAQHLAPQGAAEDLRPVEG